MALATVSRRRAIATAVSLCAGGAYVTGSRSNACAQTAAVVRIGCGNVEATPQAYFAADGGFFKKNAIDARLSVLRGGAAQIAAAVGGDVDVAEASTVAFGSAISRGIPLVAIAAGILWDSRFPSAGLVCAPNAVLKSGADLNGKTVGVTALAALGVLGIEAYMDATGGDKSTVKFVEIPAPALADAVTAGRVDAAVIEEPALSDAVRAKKVRFVIGALGGIAPSFYENVWFTRSDWLKQNGDVARRVGAAITAAGVWAENNRPASQKVMEKYTQIQVETNTERYGHSLDPALLQPAFNAAYKYKLYTTLPKAADYCWDGR